MIRAHLVAVGTELLLPGRQDTNSIWLRDRLLDLGVQVGGVSVVGDEEAALGRVLESALREARLVVVTGGLGPTEDDITRKAVARYLRRPLRYDEGVRQGLERFFEERGRRMPENCLRQALVPAEARVLPNRVGTAPGLALEVKGALLVLLPGPPREMRPLFDEQVAPLLGRRFALSPPVIRHLRLTGVYESAVDELAAPIYQRFPEVRTTILSQPGDVELVLVGPAEAGERVEGMASELRSALGPSVYSMRGWTLEAEVAHLLGKRRLRLAVAESCTGGLLGKRLTDLPGSSEYFLGSLVCYHNDWKTRLVGVSREILETHGAVSAPVASAMALGVAQRAGAQAGLGVTGIAGPGGGTPDKPVGTVFVGAVVEGRAAVNQFQFRGERDIVRFQAAQAALDMLRRLLLAPPKS